ncbi:ABC transporter permease [Dehalococcoidia bacterium]|nr:ABC transporter permease [Dehalococcoidia bacterium]
MNKMLTILKHEFRQTIKRKSFLIMTISVPLIALIGMLGYRVIQDIYQPDKPEEQRIGYVDHTGIFTGYTEQADLTFILYADEAKAKSHLLAGEIDEFFIIPSDYLATGQVIRFTMEGELAPPPGLTKQISDFLLSNLLAGEVTEQLLQRVKEPLMLASLQLDEMGHVIQIPHPLVVLFVPYVFALLFMISIFSNSGRLLQSVSEEKENRVIEILLSSVSTGQLFRGKILGLGAAGLLQMLVWLVSIRIFAHAGAMNIPALGDLVIPTSMLVLGLLYFIGGYLLFAVLYAGVGSIGSTEQDSQQWAGVFTLPAVVPMMLLSVIAQHPDGLVARILSFIPFTAPITVMMRLPNTTIPLWELALSLTIMVGSIAVGIWVVARVFRVFLLMYGKRPALREIVRYAREA